MSTSDGGGSAFARSGTDYASGSPGISRREWYASHPDEKWLEAFFEVYAAKYPMPEDEILEQSRWLMRMRIYGAYAYADAMIDAADSNANVDALKL